MLITIKSSRILEILLVSGIGAKVGEKIISYTKDCLKKQKVSKHEKSEKKDFKDQKMQKQSEKILESPTLKRNDFNIDEYVPLKEKQLEELRKKLPHEVQFDINSANVMIKMIEKRL